MNAMQVLHLVMNRESASGVETFASRLDAQLRKDGCSSQILAEFDLMPEILEDVDVVHIHGLWRPHFHRMAMRAWQQDVPIVWSPHGMLAPWSLRHKGLKKAVRVVVVPEGRP